MVSRPHIVASIEARMGSSRLPGKVLADVGGVPAIGRLVRRLRHCQNLDDIVLATSTAPGDDALVDWARTEDLTVFRGSEIDVLGRVVGAHREVKSDVVVEVTGDCTLIDAGLIDMGIAIFLSNDCDVVSNTWKTSFPMGADVQVFHRELLEQVGKTVDDPAVREHVSLYFYENPNLYRIFHLLAPPRWHDPKLRLQLDYREDLTFIRAIYDRLEQDYQDRFGVEEILKLLAREPTLRTINQHCIDKAIR